MHEKSCPLQKRFWHIAGSLDVPDHLTKLGKYPGFPAIAGRNGITALLLRWPAVVFDLFATGSAFFTQGELEMQNTFTSFLNRAGAMKGRQLLGVAGILCAIMVAPLITPALTPQTQGSVAPRMRHLSLSMMKHVQRCTAAILNICTAKARAKLKPVYTRFTGEIVAPWEWMWDRACTVMISRFSLRR